MEVEKVIWRVLFSLAEGTTESANALTQLSEDIPWDSVRACSLTDRAWFDVTLFSSLPNVNGDRAALPSEELSAEPRPNLQPPQSSNIIPETNSSVPSSVVGMDNAMEVDETRTGYAPHPGALSRTSEKEAGSGSVASMPKTHDTGTTPEQHLPATSSVGEADDELANSHDSTTLTTGHFSVASGSLRPSESGLSRDCGVSNDEEEEESKTGDSDSDQPLNKKRPSPIRKVPPKNRPQSVFKKPLMPAADVNNQKQSRSDSGASRRSRSQFRRARDSKMSQKSDNEEEDDSDQPPNKKRSPSVGKKHLRKRKRSASEETANSKDRMVRLKAGESRDHPIDVDEYLLTLETEKRILPVSSPLSVLLSLTFCGGSPT